MLKTAEEIIQYIGNAKNRHQSRYISMVMIYLRLKDSRCLVQKILKSVLGTLTQSVLI